MRRIAIASLLLAVVGSIAAGWTWLGAEPQMRPFPLPPPTAWHPTGLRSAASVDSPLLPHPDAFHTMHVGIANSDEVWIAAAPYFEHQWVAEPEMYVAEGPTFDNQGNLYFSPINPREDVSLVALDARSGRRLWAIPGRGAGCGAPLILHDPEVPGQGMIFHSTYTTAMALRPDGSSVWSVPTGLTMPTRQAGERDLTHVWGMSYHPQADAVFAVTMDGWVYAHARRDGRPLLRAPFRLPGSPAAVTGQIPSWLAALADRETDRAFGRPADGIGLFSAILDVIFGNGVNVANFYAIDPTGGDLFIAATADDDADGVRDGVSRNGALYRLELHGTEVGSYELAIADRFVFDGGTGSTPTLSADGKSVVVSDEHGNVIALDHRLQERWRIDLGSQVAASVAVSSDNSEMYAVTRYDIVKLIDQGATASIAWRANLDAYPGFDNFNALTATIAANGVVVSVGAGRRVGSQQLMTKFGMGLLDRESGRLRSFAEGREESIAVSAIGPDGAIYTAGSPVRRAMARALLGHRLPPLVGGIHRYRPRRHDLLALDAACAATMRAHRVVETPELDDPARRADMRQVELLRRQAQAALLAAFQAGEIPAAQRERIVPLLVSAAAPDHSDDAQQVRDLLGQACLKLGEPPDETVLDDTPGTSYEGAS